MVKDWLCHLCPFEYEYEYRFTEYEYKEIKTSSKIPPRKFPPSKSLSVEQSHRLERGSRLPWATLCKSQP